MIISYYDNETRTMLEREMTPEEEIQYWKDVAQSKIPVVPNRVSRRQARQALFLANKLDSVQLALDGIADPIQRGLATIEWEDSQEFERNWPLVINIGQAIGMSPSEIDALFIKAGSL